MTYFGFLVCFVGIPLLILAALTAWDRRQGRKLPPSLSRLPAGLALLTLVILAVVWTTPWDNYLVATGVWYYDPELVTGMTLGWVPIEEYTFFIVQTLLTGLWLLWLGRHLSPAGLPVPRRPKLRLAVTAAVVAIWLASIIVLLSGWLPGAYLGLEVAWLLLPVIPQVALGADVLWHHRRLVAAAWIVPSIYLSATDFVAIGSGTWTIAPAKTTGILLGGVLPIEEVLFFFMTNMLIVFGMVLFIGLDWASILQRFGRGRPVETA
jgi:lycopene cyclase domain-containing protein